MLRRVFAVEVSNHASNLTLKAWHSGTETLFVGDGVCGVQQIQRRNTHMANN